jgi:hypothetical protein
MKSALKLSATLAVAALALSGCKTSSDVSSYVDHFTITKDSQSFEYTTTFGNNLEVSLEGTFPIGNHGEIEFFQDNKGQFNIGFKANFDLFGNVSFPVVTTLPTGASFPVIVSGGLYQILVKDEPGSYKIYAYVDSALGTAGMKLAGVAIQFYNIKNNFPNLTITQSFFTDSNVRYASFTIFGPGTVNGQTVPGGIFMVGDMNQVINSRSAMIPNKMGISGPDAAKYQGDKEKQNLMKNVQRVLQSNGVVLH